jgi:putative membrane protein
MVEMIGGDVSNELSSQRTAMSFERTAFASDRTLMAMVRTALALIGFGFTIFEFFRKLTDEIPQGLPPEAPRRFGLALIVLGVVLLALGIYNHARQTSERRARRQQLYEEKLMHHPEMKRPNASLIVAVLLLLVGLAAILRVGLSVGPF